VNGPTLRVLRRLMTEVRVLGLAVVVDGEPVAGLLPFLAATDLLSLDVHVSRLARHTRGLGAGAAFSAVLHEPDRVEADPMALPRLLVRGHVESIGESELARLRHAWTSRFPSAMLTLELGDFEFRRLAIDGGRLIVGFSQAFGVGPETLAAARALGRDDGPA